MRVGCCIVPSSCSLAEMGREDSGEWRLGGPLAKEEMRVNLFQGAGSRVVASENGRWRGSERLNVEAMAVKLRKRFEGRVGVPREER